MLQTTHSASYSSKVARSMAYLWNKARSAVSHLCAMLMGWLLLLLTLPSLPTLAQTADLTHVAIPERPEPARFVNDYAHVLSSHVASELEEYLLDYDLAQTTQIVVATMPSIGDAEIMDFATTFAHTWGIGSKKNDNGVLILLVPKTADRKGEVAITPGYGLEGVLTDVLCSQIINRDMLPHLRNNDYDAAIRAAVNAVAAAANGEYSRDPNAQDEDDDMSGVLVLMGLGILAIVLYFWAQSLIARYKRAKTRREKISLGLQIGFVLGSIYVTLAEIVVRLAASSSRSGGSDGESKSSSFGGGGFGGGGAHGSW